MTEQAVQSGDAIEVAGISYRQLDLWVRAGYLHPIGGNGHGNWRSWPEPELEIARRMGRLADAGLPLEWCAQFARSSWPDGELAPGIRVVIEPDAAQCNFCDRTVRMTASGCLRVHRPHPQVTTECPGSGRLPQQGTVS